MPAAAMTMRSRPAVIFLAWLMAASLVVLGPGGIEEAHAQPAPVALADDGDPCVGTDAAGDAVDGTVEVREYDGEWWGRTDDSDIIDAWGELYPDEPLPASTPDGYRYDVEVCFDAAGEIVALDFGMFELVAADAAQGWYDDALDGAVDGLDLKAPGWVSFPDRDHNQIVYLDTWFYVENHWDVKTANSQSGEVRVDVSATPIGVDYRLIPQADGQAEIEFPPCVGRGEVWTKGAWGPSSCSAPPWEHSTSILDDVEVRGRTEYRVVVTQTTLSDDDANGRGGVVTTTSVDNRWGPWDIDDDTPDGSRYYFQIAEVQTYGLVGDAVSTGAPTPAGPTPGGDTIGVSCSRFDVWCKVIKPIGGVLIEFFIPEELLNIIEECASAFGDAFGSFTDLLGMLNPDNWGDIWNDFQDVKNALTTAHDEGRLISVLTEMAIEAGESALQLDKLKDADGNWDLSFENVSGWISYMACDTIIGIVTGGLADKLTEFAQGVRRWQGKRDRGEDTGPSDRDRHGSSCPLAASSFPGYSLVLLADGTHKRIDQIKPGDYVLSYNTDTSVWEPQLVVDQWSHLDRGPPATVTLSDRSTITATDDHRFLVPNIGQWVELQNVQSSDQLLTPSGTVDVDRVTLHAARDWIVWELTVAGNHNFAVHSGTVDVLVHNGCRTEPSNPPDPDATAKGEKTKIDDDHDAETKRSLNRENETADTLAQAGYDIEQNPTVLDSDGLADGKDPDYRIEGEIFDNYAPGPDTSVRNVVSNVGDKVTAGQTKRVVLDLTDSNLTVADILQQIKDWPGDVAGLEDLIIVDGGAVVGGWAP